MSNVIPFPFPKSSKVEIDLENRAEAIAEVLGVFDDAAISPQEFWSYFAEDYIFENGVFRWLDKALATLIAIKASSPDEAALDVLLGDDEGAEPNG
jgi:hypothetical protein